MDLSTSTYHSPAHTAVVHTGITDNIFCLTYRLFYCNRTSYRAVQSAPPVVVGCCSPGEFTPPPRRISLSAAVVWLFAVLRVSEEAAQCSSLALSGGDVSGSVGAAYTRL